MSEQKLRSEDVIERATLDEKEMQFLYSDGDGYHFMDTETYEQIHMTAEALGESVGLPQAGDDRSASSSTATSRSASSCRRPST